MGGDEVMEIKDEKYASFRAMVSGFLYRIFEVTEDKERLEAKEKFLPCLPSMTGIDTSHPDFIFRVGEVLTHMDYFYEGREKHEFFPIVIGPDEGTYHFLKVMEDTYDQMMALKKSGVNFAV